MRNFTRVQAKGRHQRCSSSKAGIRTISPFEIGHVNDIDQLVAALIDTCVGTGAHELWAVMPSDAQRGHIPVGSSLIDVIR